MYFAPIPITLILYLILLGLIIFSYGKLAAETVQKLGNLTLGVPEKPTTRKVLNVQEVLSNFNICDLIMLFCFINTTNMKSDKKYFKLGTHFDLFIGHIF